MDQFSNAMTHTLDKKRQPPLGKKVIAARLRDMAYARGPGAKLPTRRELCGELGTSASTIDDVLNELEALRIITRRQGSGIYVSPTLHRKLIAVTLFSDYVEQVEASPFWSHLWQMLSETAVARAENHEQDFTFHVVTRMEHPRLPGSLAKLIETRQVLGVIGIGLTPAWAQWIKEQGAPVVAFAGAGHYHVNLIADQIVTIGVPKLVEQGCRRIALIESARDGQQDEVAIGRIARFPDILETAGLDCDSGRIYLDLTDGSLQDRGYKAVMDLLAGRDSTAPDGLVIMNDMVTSGALVALNRLGLTLGRDVRIASHGNAGSPILYGYKDDMVLIEVDAAKIVDALFEKLDRVLAGHGDDEPHETQVSLRLREPVAV
jgi:DNA-binding LacI/PurR family transcriptional regulator